jgi:iron transport multicopper oxidase
MFDKVPAGLNQNVTSYLVYDSTKGLPAAQTIDQFNPFDDFNLVPTDGQGLLENVDHSISLQVNMGVLGDGVN